MFVFSSDSTEFSSDDENLPLGTYLRTGSQTLLSAPWNKPLQQSKADNQSNNCNSVPDWAANIHSPIKSFVPISQQEDADYFNRQFNYKKDKVMNMQNKRKRTSTGRKKKRKRRRVYKKSK